MIFISYRISDANQFVARLDDSLTAEFGPDAIFRDKTRIKGGQQWPKEVEENAKSCPIMLVVIGKTWQSAAFADGEYMGFPRLHDPEDWVRREITIALDARNTVIPIFVDGATMPNEKWLANFKLDRLAHAQGIPIRTDDYDTDLPKLVDLFRKTCPALPKAIAGDDQKRAAERRWEYIQAHPIRGIEIVFILRESVGFDWFRELLDDTPLTFSRNEPSFKLGQLLAASPAPNTKEHPSDSDQPVCSFWEVYKPQPGYWVKKVAPTPREFSVVAGFDAVVPWSVLGVQRVAKLEDLALLTDVGVSIPARAYQAGVEEFAVRFIGDTFSFSVRLSEHGLGALHEFARVQHTTVNNEKPMPLGVHFSGVQLLDLFLHQLLPRPKDEEPARGIFGGLSGPDGKAITFYPDMPVGFTKTPESDEYTFTVTVPPKIDSAMHIKALQETIELNPADTESYVKLAALYSYEGRLQDVIRCLEVAIEQAPPSDGVHGVMGEALLKLGRFDEALTQFQKAALLAPSKAAAQAGLGVCLHKLGNDEAAFVHFEAAARMEPSRADYQRHLSMALTDQNRYSEAILPAQRAVQLAPDEAQNAMLLGILLDMDGRWAEAIPYFETATQLAPASAEAHELLGQHLAKANQHEKAVGSFQRAIDIEETKLRVALLAVSLDTLNRWPEAEAACRRVVELDPNHPGAMVNLAVVVSRLGKVEEAVDLCQRALTIQKDVRAYALLGQSLLSLRRSADAEAAMRCGLQLEPKHAGLLANLGIAAANLGRDAEAAELFEQSLRADPNNVTVQRYLVQLREKTG